MNLEFTVDFYNWSDVDFVAKNLHIPIKAGDNVVASAQPVDVGSDLEFAIPAQRDEAISIRFRALLDTTQSLALLELMGRGSPPTVSVESSQGSITASTADGRVDAVAAITRIRRKTCKITVEVDDTEFTWRVARRDEKTRKALKLGDAFDALNALAATEDAGAAKMFVLTGNYLRSAFGHDCTVDPARWWVMSPAHSATPEMDADVDPALPLPEAMVLRQRSSFPGDMKRWAQVAEGSDGWAFMVAGHLWDGGFGGLHRDEKKAVEFWRKAADLRDARAIWLLGSAHYKGLGGLAT